MNQEDKKLLLKDLCARLPYYPKCEMIDELRVVNNEKDSSYTEYLFPRHLEIFYFHNNFTIKPFLRPMSSMTEEEYRDLKSISSYYGFAPYEYIGDCCPNYEMVDWLNSHHFDYRGLIEKGLAIEVTDIPYNP